MVADRACLVLPVPGADDVAFNALAADVASADA